MFVVHPRFNLNYTQKKLNLIVSDRVHYCTKTKSKERKKETLESIYYWKSFGRWRARRKLIDITKCFNKLLDKYN